MDEANYDPNAPPLSDTASSSTAETPNRPEPAVETPNSASESADLSAEAEAKEETQPQPANTITQSASIASEGSEAPTQASEAQPMEATPSPSQQPEAEAVLQSTPPISEPTTVPPVQGNGTLETDQEKQENQEPQGTTEPQVTLEPEAPQPQNPPPSSIPSTPSIPSIPSLHFPFYGNNPITFDFGAQPTEEKIKKKYEEWGIVGHNGIDFGLQEGTEILACDEGTVIQAGDNGDHGISVTIKHSWGTSIYSHLQSLGALVNDTVKKAQVIGSSGQTGFTTGPHLHFGIQPSNPDTNNGYLGYINPAPYLTESSPLPQSPLPADLSAEASAKVEASAQESISPQSPLSPDLSGDLSEEKPVEEISVAPAKQSEPQPPQSPLSPQSPQPEINEEEIQKQAVDVFDARIKENSIKGNQAKKDKRNEAIQKIFAFAQEKKRITNEQVRDLLHVSQSTASDYLSDLVNRSMLKVEGKGRATVYVF